MRMLFATLALAATTAFTALPAVAAVLDIPGATADFLIAPAGDAGDFLFDAEGILNDGTDFLPVDVRLALIFETADPYGTATAFVDISDMFGLVFSGLLSSIGYEEDLLKLVFAGAGAGVFGDGLSLDLFFIDPVGSNPLAALVDGASYDIAALGQDVAPVPLPGSLPLLAGALGFMVLRRRMAARA
ncbi:MAG: hypothetical protein JXR75_03785 [Rhodobacteraceae bacterium]|nr:hypothetical protein [Paracoccaceae bacterium]